MDVEPSLATTLAPEDIRPGTYVAVVRVCYEYPSFLWCDSSLLAPDEPVRIEWLPWSAGVPLKVQAVCLPFVLVKTPQGESQTLDIRSLRLAQLNDEYARVAWKRLKKAKAAM